jgi:hypothetical protein
VLSRLQLTEDVARGELVARPVDGVAGVALTPGAVSIEVAHSVTLPGPANDLDLSATGIALVTFSHQKAERSYEVHEAERKGDFPPPTPRSGAALVDLTASSPALGAQLVSQHLGFAVTGAISPDGKTVVTGGWDRRVLVWDVTSREVVTERSFAWLVRRLRLSPDGRLLGVSAWTPVNALNEGDSEPSMVLYPLSLTSPRVVTPRE